MASKDYLDFYDEQPIVKDNVFKTMEPDRSAPPALADVRHLLPSHLGRPAPHIACATGRLGSFASRICRRCTAAIVPPTSPP